MKSLSMDSTRRGWLRTSDPKTLQGPHPGTSWKRRKMGLPDLAERARALSWSVCHWTVPSSGGVS